ncbi:uncharacterized protein [Elaeis guineensis]|uniref:Uncharacterized protein LOC105057646 n=1 Tax=Elaeis guineensis var. tenera TaxID=51953 RepID=A0A6J0PL70_ELAGV|nr:uncharacterized protein LOC105057646 [Elaeis guineensis]
MGWAMLAALLAIQAISSSLLPPRAAAEDVPKPGFNEICDGVECGRGTCQVSANAMFGFECKCDPGWTQFGFQDHLRFLPCIMPNCTFDYACYNDSMAQAAQPLPKPADFSFFDPCFWSLCGNGTCVRKSGFGHHCQCNEGFSNLLNVTSLPCFRDCTLGADCINLGFTLSNSSYPSSPNFSKIPSEGSSTAYSLWLYIMMVWLAVTRTMQMEL